MKDRLISLLLLFVITFTVAFFIYGVWAYVWYPAHVETT